MKNDLWKHYIIDYAKRRLIEALVSRQAAFIEVTDNFTEASSNDTRRRKSMLSPEEAAEVRHISRHLIIDIAELDKVFSRD